MFGANKSKGRRVASKILAAIAALSIPLQAHAISNRSVTTWKNVEEIVNHMTDKPSVDDLDRLKILVNNAIIQLKKDVDVDIDSGDYDNGLLVLDTVMLEIMVQIRKNFPTANFEPQLSELIKIRNNITNARSSGVGYKLKIDIKKELKTLIDYVTKKGSKQEASKNSLGRRDITLNYVSKTLGVVDIILVNNSDIPGIQIVATVDGLRVDFLDFGFDGFSDSYFDVIFGQSVHGSRLGQFKAKLYRDFDILYLKTIKQIKKDLGIK